MDAPDKLLLEKRLEDARNKLARINDERRQVLDEISVLEKKSAIVQNNQNIPHLFPNAAINNYSPPEKKISLFRSLFKGREDVYPRRWENVKTGKSGYQPVCKNEWIRGLCQKPRIKCGKCDNRELLPVTDAVIRNHLSGMEEASSSGQSRDFTIGIYPILSDDSCWFLAVDFDKATWTKDACAFLETCDKNNIAASLERSRSGNGGHVWIFFSEPIPAILARKLGSFLITATMDARPEIGFDSYDRLFPNQDTLPKGGYGNLIALPMQKKPRENGNSIFVDINLVPYEDQWAYLSSIKHVSFQAVVVIVENAEKNDKILSAHKVYIEDENIDEPWNLSPSKRKEETVIEGPLPAHISMVSSNQIYIPKDCLSPSLQNRFIHTAAFQNPEFYKAQAMRLPVYDKPRIISCAENFPKHLAIPRGCLDEIIRLLISLKIQYSIQDERNSGSPIHVEFKGKLRPEQELAAAAMMNHDTGVLSATTAFGKTVIAAYLIAKRGVNTLVLVHRQQLLDQWLSQLSCFLGIKPAEIGKIGAGKRNPIGLIDVAVIQSLSKKAVVDDLVGGYGHLIVDECHHIPARTFEIVSRQCKAKYVTGLSATVARKDGHHPIIFMQCGEVRYRVDARSQASSQAVDHKVVLRKTNFTLPETLSRTDKISINDIYLALAADERRNDLIFEDILMALEQKRSPILITERKDHLLYFSNRLASFARNVITFYGGMGSKQRKKIADKMKSISDDQERVLLSTGRYLGEGFDDSRLDTLFLTMPISWKGTLAQYVGRLHRHHSGKSDVVVYDYVDSEVPMLMRMMNRRIRGYKAIGYEIDEGHE
jgi:superfamily II DNA or RNA helicase